MTFGFNSFNSSNSFNSKEVEHLRNLNYSNYCNSFLKIIAEGDSLNRLREKRTRGVRQCKRVHFWTVSVQKWTLTAINIIDYQLIVHLAHVLLLQGAITMNE